MSAEVLCGPKRIVYMRPLTIAFLLRREQGELIEFACHAEDRDLPRLKTIKDSAAGKK